MLYLTPGLRFYLNGQMYPNNSNVTITDILELVIMLYSVFQTAAVVVGALMEWLVMNGSFLEDLVLLMIEGNLPQLLTSVEVEDPMQFS